MSITKGLGEYWGNYLLSEPFKMKLIRLIKKIIKKIIRAIPWKRKKFKIKIRVCGDLVVPFVSSYRISGFPLEVVSKELKILGEKSIPFTTDLPLVGDVFTRIRSDVRIIAETVIPISSNLEILGDCSHPISVNLAVKGKRDISKQIWLVLEDEE